MHERWQYEWNEWMTLCCRDRKVNQNPSPLAITTPYHHLTPLPLFPQLIYPHYLGLSETVTRISYQFTICNVHLLLKALKGFVVGAVTFLYLTPKDFLVFPYFLILFFICNTMAFCSRRKFVSSHNKILWTFFYNK